MRNIVLIGMRGSGKSTIGRHLARKLGMKFVDSDLRAEMLAGRKIPEIVAIEGWEGFRKLEKTVCRELGNRENTVIATGGGVVLDDENVEALRANGTIIFLAVSPEEIARRIYLSTQPKRPSLTGKGTLKELNEVWEERKERYFAAADFVVKTQRRRETVREALDEIVAEIIRQLAEHAPASETGN